MPDLVQAQIRLHVAETEIRLETTKAAMAGRAVTTAESRRLRSTRDRLAEELAGWRYLAMVAESDHYAAYREGDKRCDDTAT